MSGCGYHWTPCSSGGGIGGAVALGALVVVIVKRQAIETGLTDLAELAAAVAGGLLVVAVTAGVIIWRIRRRRRQARPLPITRVQRPPAVTVLRPAVTTRPANVPALPRTSASTQTRADADTHAVTSRTAPKRCTQPRDRRRY